MYFNLNVSAVTISDNPPVDLDLSLNEIPRAGGLLPKIPQSAAHFLQVV